jgi:hypothetical protein
MKQIIALTFCLLSILKSTAQGTISCDSLIKKQYKISEVTNNQHFLEEVRAAILCKYDSLDMYIFMGPNGNGPLTMIAPLAVKRAGTPHEDKLSMSELMQTFSSMRDMPGYGELRNKITLIMQQVKPGISDQLYKDRPVTGNKDDIVATKILNNRLFQAYMHSQITRKAYPKQRNLGSLCCFISPAMLAFPPGSLKIRYCVILKLKRS